MIKINTKKIYYILLYKLKFTPQSTFSEENINMITDAVYKNKS